MTGFLLRRAWWLPLWAVLLIASIGLTVAARGGALPGDTRVLSWLQDLPFPGVDLSEAVRAITSTEVVLGTGAVVAAGLWLTNRRREALLLAAGIIILPFLQHGIKEIVDRPRPGPDVADLRAGYSSPAFPAGHVMSAMVLYGFLLYLAAKGRFSGYVWPAVGAFSAVVLLLTGAANVYVGVHWPTDVLGGYLWGLVLLLPLIALDSTLPGKLTPSLAAMKLRSSR